MADDLKFLDTRGDEIVKKFKIGAHGDLVPKDIDLFQTLKHLKADSEKGPTQMESNIFRQFAQDSSSFNNEELQTNLNKLDNYYS